MWSNEWQIKGSLPSACCLINTGSMLFAISVARVHSWLTFSSISAGHLRPFPAELLHSQCPVCIFSRSTSFPYAELCTCLWISWGFFQLQLISFSEDLQRRVQTQCSTRTLSSKWPLLSDNVHLSFLTTSTLKRHSWKFCFQDLSTLLLYWVHNTCKHHLPFKSQY